MEKFMQRLNKVREGPKEEVVDEDSSIHSNFTAKLNPKHQNISELKKKDGEVSPNGMRFDLNKQRIEEIYAQTTSKCNQILS